MIQKKIFTGGMNSDTADEYLPAGSDRYRLNVRVLSSDSGNDGSIETMNGNTLVSFSLPAGTNKVIGAKEYLIQNKIYYFVYNSSNNHSILEYNSALNTIATVIQTSLLDFNTSFLITGIDIIQLDASNHLLYWTDNRNEPRKINIEKAKYYTAGNYTLGYPTPLEERFFTQIKQPPQTPPTVAWTNTAAQLINYLFKKNFTFKSLFVYDDYEESSYSPISKYVMPITALATPSTGEDFETQYNTLNVTVPTGSAIVKKIRIAAKETNSNDYYVVAELDKELLGIANDSTYTFIFFNDGNYIPVEVNQSIKLFDNVPQLAQAQALISGNRLTWGNITEGYDSVDVDMRLPLSYEVLTTNPNSFFPAVSYLKPGGSYIWGLVYYDEFGNRSGTTNVVNQKSTALIGSTVGTNIYGTTLNVPFVTDPLYTGADMSYVPILKPEIYNKPPAWAKYYQLLRSKNIAMDRYIQFAAQNVVYVDDSKVIPVPPASAAYVKIFTGNITGRYLDENPLSKLVYDYATGDRIRFIYNPVWVTLTPTAGAIAPAGGNDYTYSVAAPASINTATAFFSFNDNEIVSYDSTTGEILIKMTANIPSNLVPGALFEIYQPAENAIDSNEIMFETGEVRPIITLANGQIAHGGTTMDQKYVGLVSATYVAPTFTATVGVGHGLVAGMKVKVVTSGYSVFGEVTASGATTATIDTTGFTLVGVFNGALTGEITVAAVFNFSGGDSFRRYQDMPFVLNGNVRRFYSYVDAENASNMFPSKMWNVGRPNRIDPEYKQIVRPSTIYYSESFIPETFINGLSTVYDLSFETYEDKYGGIYKLFNENHQLTVFQELKVGGLPTGQVVINSTSGSSVVGQSADVLPETMEYYAGEYGIGKHPESFAVYGNAKYFIDVKRGTPVRLSTDGMTPIGDTGFMHNFFTDTCELIVNANKKINIYGVYDTKFNEYILATEGYTSGVTVVPAGAVGWNEKRNMWSSFYQFDPDFMCTNNINIISWKAGALYTHNTNAVQTNFYGVQYYPEVWCVLNDNPSNVKVFEAIGEETSSPWEVTSIANPEGQSSNLIVSDFSSIENQQYAAVLRDANTPNVVAPELALFAGDPMRSRTFVIKFKYPLTTYNKLFAVNLKYIISNLHNR